MRLWPWRLSAAQGLLAALCCCLSAHGMEEVYVAGPMVSNAAALDLCPGAPMILSEAQAACDAEESCSGVILSYDCQSAFWKWCSSSVGEALAHGDTSDAAACSSIQQRLYSTVTSTTTVTVEFVEGPRVGNEAYVGHCSEAVSTPEVAEASCKLDPNCEVLHSFDCMDWTWRYCWSWLPVIQEAAEGTEACTQVHKRVLDPPVPMADGPRVGNAAWQGRCSSIVSTSLEESQERCRRDPRCTFLHSWDCEPWAWRVCHSSIQDISDAGPETDACTMVPHYLTTSSLSSTTSATDTSHTSSTSSATTGTSTATSSTTRTRSTVTSTGTSSSATKTSLTSSSTLSTNSLTSSTSATSQTSSSTTTLSSTTTRTATDTSTVTASTETTTVTGTTVTTDTLTLTQTTSSLTSTATWTDSSSTSATETATTRSDSSSNSLTTTSVSTTSASTTSRSSSTTASTPTTSSSTTGTATTTTATSVSNTSVSTTTVSDTSTTSFHTATATTTSLYSTTRTSTYSKTLTTSATTTSDSETGTTSATAVTITATTESWTSSSESTTTMSSSDTHTTTITSTTTTSPHSVTVPSLSTISGSMEIQVENASAFVEDPGVHEALRAAIADTTGADTSEIDLSLRVVPSSSPARRLQGSSAALAVEVSFTLQIPESEAEAASAAFSESSAGNSSSFTSVLQVRMQEAGVDEAYGSISVSSLRSSIVVTTTPLVQEPAEEKASLVVVIAVVVCLIALAYFTAVLFCCMFVKRRRLEAEKDSAGNKDQHNQVVHDLDDADVPSEFPEMTGSYHSDASDLLPRAELGLDEDYFSVHDDMLHPAAASLGPRLPHSTQVVLPGLEDRGPARSSASITLNIRDSIQKRLTTFSHSEAPLEEAAEEAPSPQPTPRGRSDAASGKAQSPRDRRQQEEQVEEDPELGVRGENDDSDVPLSLSEGEDETGEDSSQCSDQSRPSERSQMQSPSLGDEWMWRDAEPYEGEVGADGHQQRPPQRPSARPPLPPQAGGSSRKPTPSRGSREREQRQPAQRGAQRSQSSERQGARAADRSRSHRTEGQSLRSERHQPSRSSSKDRGNGSQPLRGSSRDRGGSSSPRRSSRDHGAEQRSPRGQHRSSRSQAPPQHGPPTAVRSGGARRTPPDSGSPPRSSPGGTRTPAGHRGGQERAQQLPRGGPSRGNRPRTQ